MSLCKQQKKKKKSNLKLFIGQKNFKNKRDYFFKTLYLYSNRFLKLMQQDFEPAGIFCHSICFFFILLFSLCILLSVLLLMSSSNCLYVYHVVTWSIGKEKLVLLFNFFYYTCEECQLRYRCWCCKRKKIIMNFIKKSIS